MPSVFLYGTLRHEPLLARVLGATPGPMRPARLPDHAVRSVAGAPYPALVTAADEGADGVLLTVPDAAGWGRLCHYEGAFGYAPAQVTVETPEGTVTAWVFRPAQTPATGGAWSLAAWVRTWGALSVEAAGEVMAHMGHKSPREIGRDFDMIRGRAHSRLLARLTRPRPPVLTALTQAEVRLIAHRRPYAGYFAFEEQDLQFPLFGEGHSETVSRAALVATDAALVLPYDPRRDEVLLLEQFRPGPYLRGDPRPWCLEPVAGRVDAGEDPEATARRETEEEAAVTLERLETISRCYPSPGCSTEFFHIYLGLVDLSRPPAEVGGLAEEAENIRRHVLPLRTVVGWADAGLLDVAPLELAVHWLARHRDRLRASG
ncbi:MAG: NUDIX domain-containing protein [Rhodosalinus sp.]|uniref:NUDIX domain-containing protein n=1 Tax=Rhodosalinus sp. TaxID=2047741 RepID=UPI00397AB132